MKYFKKSPQNYILLLNRFKLTVKLILLTISAYTFEPIANCFNLNSQDSPFDLKEMLYFSNISLTYTFVCIIIGYFNKRSLKLKKLYNFILPTAFVFESMVTILFWVLYFINPKLVKHNVNLSSGFIVSSLKEVPKHLSPLIILCIEQTRTKTRKSWCHRIFLISFGIIYFAIIELDFIFSGKYLYPFFKYLSLFSKILIMLTTSFISIFIYEFCVRKKIENSKKYGGKQIKTGNLLRLEKSKKNKIL